MRQFILAKAVCTPLSVPYVLVFSLIFAKPLGGRTVLRCSSLITSAFEIFFIHLLTISNFVWFLFSFGRTLFSPFAEHRVIILTGKAFF